MLRRYLRTANSGRVLVGAVNDSSAIGAIRAFEEAGRAETCAAVGQNASIEARREMRTARSPLIGSVAYFPERYGDAVIPIALNVLRGKTVPPALFVRHKLVTSENVDRMYPTDSPNASGGTLSLSGECDKRMTTSYFACGQG